MFFHNIKVEECHGDGDELWVTVVGGERVYLNRNEDDIFEIDFSHSVIICKKCSRFCDYEYLNCPCNKYAPSVIASRARRPGGSTIYHCVNGESKWLNPDEAQKQRPDYCNRLKNLVGL